MPNSHCVPEISPIRRRLLRWFSRHQRELPWRSEPTPYRVWVSEIMLQQTQVATVIPYFERFVRRFPDPRALAAAGLDDVLALWAGLGYYSRARNLHRAARMIVQSSGGKIPDTLDGLLALPGVGRYSAGAILSIAFDQPAAILDGNVTRVLCRLAAIGGDPRTPANQRRLWALAGELVDPRRPSQFNQAMMELGALVCVAAAPNCAACPLATICRANRLGRQTDFPAVRPRSRVKLERWAVAVVRRGGRVLLVRRPIEGRWGGLWEFPGRVVSRNGKPEPTVRGDSHTLSESPRRDLSALLESLRAHLSMLLGLRGIALNHIGSVRHQLTHRDLRVEVFACELPRRVAATPRDSRRGEAKGEAGDNAWVQLSAMDDYPVSTLTRKIAVMSSQARTAGHRAAGV